MINEDLRDMIEDRQNYGEREILLTCGIKGARIRIALQFHQCQSDAR
jgi:hypothetical protein